MAGGGEPRSLNKEHKALFFCRFACQFHTSVRAVRGFRWSFVLQNCRVNSSVPAAMQMVHLRFTTSAGTAHGRIRVRIPYNVSGDPDEEVSGPETASAVLGTGWLPPRHAMLVAS